MTLKMPDEEEQRAINHILRSLNDTENAYTEEGDFNRNVQADMAVADLIPPYMPSTIYPLPRPYSKRQLKALYKLGYRLSADDRNHKIEESFTEDELSMLTSANTVFNLHDHKKPMSRREYYGYLAKRFSSGIKNLLVIRFKKIWHTLLDMVSTNDKE